MAEVITRPTAQLDMEEIDLYGIVKFGNVAAEHYMVGFFDAFDRLARFPEIGPIYPGIRPVIRFLTYREHHIFYDFDGETVVVVRILHHAANAKYALVQ
ncbi:MAG: type II toxin-antitoxin system RelE/ParE family toxin [Novosphingobium sp.]